MKTETTLQLSFMSVSLPQAESSLPPRPVSRRIPVLAPVQVLIKRTQASRMRGVAGSLLCLLFVGGCVAEDFVRVPLLKRPITAERFQAASQVAAKTKANRGLLGAHVEADIPLRDYLDAQARSSNSGFG